MKTFLLSAAGVGHSTSSVHTVVHRLLVMVIHQVQCDLIPGRHEGVDQLPGVARQVYVAGEDEKGQDAENDTI